MLYLLPSGGSWAHVSERDFGVLVQPRNRGVSLSVKEGRPWGYDNDCFNGGFNQSQWASLLAKYIPHRDSCMFITVPDHVGDAQRTLELWDEHYSFVSSFGFPLAFVAQDGQENLPFPTQEFSWVFLGGTNDFKLGRGGVECVNWAKENGKKVHMGRVNSRKRIRYAKQLGCDSVDGTFVCFGRDINTPKLVRWMAEVNTQ